MSHSDVHYHSEFIGARPHPAPAAPHWQFRAFEDQSSLLGTSADSHHGASSAIFQPDMTFYPPMSPSATGTYFGSQEIGSGSEHRPSLLFSWPPGPLSTSDTVPADIWSHLDAAYQTSPAWYGGSSNSGHDIASSFVDLDDQQQQVFFSESGYAAADGSCLDNDSASQSQSPLSEATGMLFNLWPLNDDPNKSSHASPILPHVTASRSRGSAIDAESQPGTDDADVGSNDCPSPVRRAMSRPSASASRSNARTASRKKGGSPYSRASRVPSSSPSSPSPSSVPLSATRRRNTVLSPAECAKYRGRAPTMPADRHCPACKRSLGEGGFKRHFETHLPQDPNMPRFVCCGIPLEDALAKKGAALESLEVHTFRGYELAGGCWQTFSRCDAYLRHLRKSGHWGDARGPWLAADSVRQEQPGE